MAEYRSEELAAAALAHLRFASVRKPAQPLVRVYNAEEARDGWTSRHTVVEVTVEDMPFLVDSLGMVLTQAGLTIHMMVHPVLAVRRDRRGRLVELAEGDRTNGQFRRESWQHIQIDRIGDEQRCASWNRSSCARSSDVQAAVADWQAMRQRAVEVAQEIDAPPAAGQAAAKSTNQGAARVDGRQPLHVPGLSPVSPAARPHRGHARAAAGDRPGHPARRDAASSAEPTVLTGEVRERARQPDLLTITKANSMSTVHRATYLDYVGLKTFDSTGRVTGEKRFLGLFTSAVYNRSPREIPLLRHKIDSVVAHFGLDPASHDGKAVVHVLETYPRDELFQASVPELIRTVRGIVNLYERQRVRVFLRRDAFGRFYSALIFVPRDRYNTQVRQRMESVINQQLHATAIESQVQLSDSALARVHMIIRVPSASSATVDADALERLIAETVRTWNDRLRAALIETRGELEGRMLADRFANAFPAAYEEDVAIPVALEDIRQLGEVIADPDRIAMRLAADPTASAETIHLRLFRSAVADCAVAGAADPGEHGLRGAERASVSHRRARRPPDLAAGFPDAAARRRHREPGGARPAVHGYVRRGLERARGERRLQSAGRRDDA